MANMMDYLDWRGDLPFTASPFNEVDNLILANLSYVNFDGIVPEEGKGEVAIEQAAMHFFQIHSPEELEADKSFVRKAPTLLRGASTTRRFAGTKLRNYISRMDLEKSLQFSALEFVLPNGDSYISFRGTDDTLVGWKEDFYLSCTVVPAQREAVAYLDRIIPPLWEQKGALYIGGHSKGGNLSEYASACARGDIQGRITRIFNNDGPGFDEGFLTQEGYQRIAPKITFLVPSYSIVGKLLDHGVEESVVQSTEKTVMAHDAFTWQVLGNRFVKVPKVDDICMVFNRSLDSWISALDEEGREGFIEDLFTVLEAPGATTLTELQNDGMGSALAMAKSLEQVEPATRRTILELLRILLDNWGEYVKEVLRPFMAR